MGILGRRVKNKKISSYDIVADPGFSSAKLTKSNKYSQYLAEHLDRNIEYSEHLDRNIEYLAEQYKQVFDREVVKLKEKVYFIEKVKELKKGWKKLESMKGM